VYPEITFIPVLQQQPIDAPPKAQFLPAHKSHLDPSLLVILIRFGLPILGLWQSRSALDLRQSYYTFVDKLVLVWNVSISLFLDLVGPKSLSWKYTQTFSLLQFRWSEYRFRSSLGCIISGMGRFHLWVFRSGKWYRSILLGQRLTNTFWYCSTLLHGLVLLED